MAKTPKVKQRSFAFASLHSHRTNPPSSRRHHQSVSAAIHPCARQIHRRSSSSNHFSPYTQTMGSGSPLEDTQRRLAAPIVDHHRDSVDPRTCLPATGRSSLGFSRPRRAPSTTGRHPFTPRALSKPKPNPKPNSSTALLQELHRLGIQLQLQQLEAGKQCMDTAIHRLKMENQLLQTRVEKVETAMNEHLESAVSMRFRRMC